MAIIDFKCNECGAKFDEIVNSTNREMVKCSKCGSKNIKQIFEGKCNTVGANKGTGSCSGGNCGGCSGCH
ncbi:MAG: FmdB family zinc ribbon protein [Caulobacteraceae bacterium]